MMRMIMKITGGIKECNYEMEIEGEWCGYEVWSDAEDEAVQEGFGHLCL